MNPLPDSEARALRSRWTLDESVRFLNHGSFGACPRVVLEEQARFRARLERQPLQFFRDLEGMLDEARAIVATFLGADADDLAFVPNASTGVGCVIRSLAYSPGDELLTTDHVYNSCRNVLELVAAQTGARVVVAQIPFPLEHPSQVTQAILAAATKNTKLALIDHVTSATGLVFPIQEIVRGLQESGIDVLVDGAHAPGMLPLNLNQLGAAYYTGNFHKWVCTPKGSAFLHVRRDKQLRPKASKASRDPSSTSHLPELPAILPWTISHGLNSSRTDRSRFRIVWDLVGTVDATPWLSVPAGIRFLETLLPGGLLELQQRNHARALEGQKLLCDALRIPLPAPAEMIGSLASIPLPDRPANESFDAPTVGWDPLCGRLNLNHQIEVPVFSWPTPEKRLTRIACQIYSTRAELEALANALLAELASEQPSNRNAL